jgi:hypothetical protein
MQDAGRLPALSDPKAVPAGPKGSSSSIVAEAGARVPSNCRYRTPIARKVPRTTGGQTAAKKKHARAGIKPCTASSYCRQCRDVAAHRRRAIHKHSPEAQSQRTALTRQVAALAVHRQARLRVCRQQALVQGDFSTHLVELPVSTHFCCLCTTTPHSSVRNACTTQQEPRCCQSHAQHCSKAQTGSRHTTGNSNTPWATIRDPCSCQSPMYSDDTTLRCSWAQHKAPAEV